MQSDAMNACLTSLCLACHGHQCRKWLSPAILSELPAWLLGPWAHLLSLKDLSLPGSDSGAPHALSGHAHLFSMPLRDPKAVLQQGLLEAMPFGTSSRPCVHAPTSPGAAIAAPNKAATL